MLAQHVDVNAHTGQREDMNDMFTLTCKFYMHLISRAKKLDVLATVGSKVFHCPGSEYRVLILVIPDLKYVSCH